MESLHKSVLIGFIAGIVLVLTTCLAFYYVSCSRQIEMAKLGYEQIQTIGQRDYVWQKQK